MPRLVGSIKHVFRRTSCYTETNSFVESLSDESTENLTVPSNSFSEGEEPQATSRGRRTHRRNNSRPRSRSSSRTRTLPPLGRMLRRAGDDAPSPDVATEEPNLQELHYAEQWLPFTHNEDSEQQAVDSDESDSPRAPSLEISSVREETASPTRHRKKTTKRPIRNRLHKGVLAVQNAGIRTVNGAYRCTGVNDSVGVYTKEGFWNDERVTFSIFRCQHKDLTRRWYVGIVADGYPPGTKHDIDLYSALSSVSGQASCLVDETPPDCGWRAVVGSGLLGTGLDSAPLCLWIPEDNESDEEIEEDEDELEEGEEQKEQQPRRRRIMRCVVCLERPVSYVFVPCGHPAVCGGCAMVWGNRMPNGEARCCPIGRCKVGAVMRFYGTVMEDVLNETQSEPTGSDSDKFVDHFALD